MIETSLKHLLLTIVSKMLQLSSKRGVFRSSTITWRQDLLSKNLKLLSKNYTIINSK